MPVSSPIAPSPALADRLLSVQITSDQDFLLARQRAKQIAGLLGFDVQDQTRIATAVSEIARNAFEYGRDGRAEYFYEAAPSPQMRIVVSDKGPGIPHLNQILNGEYRSQNGMGIGLTGAKRLVDGMDIDTSSSGTRVTLLKRLPARVAAAPPQPAAVAASLTQQGSAKSNTLQEQNEELLSLLTELRNRETELQRLNQELEETNRGVLVLYAELEDKAIGVQQSSEMKTRFLSGVTHELRTPLNSVVSLARLLLSNTDGVLNPEQQKQVQFILRSAQNLSEMVNDLLDLARIEAGKTVVKLSTFTVADTLAALRGMFRPLAMNEHVDLIFDIPAQAMTLRTDEGKLAQILRNFISNALKFTESGTVTVTAKAAPSTFPPNTVVFSVKDTGIGIAPENFELVMQEWGQVDDALHSAHKGSGLGLPLSRRFAEILGGRIWFESNPGAGSTFHVALPALVSTGEEGPTASELSSHILTADDDEVARYLLRRRLSKLTNATIEECSSGEECLAALRRNPPRILFIDLVMAGMTGLEVAAIVRSETGIESLPIVLVTSKPLTTDELAQCEALNVTVVSKQIGEDDDADSRDHHLMQLERSLLQVGLSNLHQDVTRS